MSTFGHQTGDPTHSLRATAVCTTVISAVIQQAETVWIWDKCRPAEVCFQTRLASTPEEGVTWSFGVDLLNLAVGHPHESVGEGDVIIKLDANVCGINIRSPEGAASLIFRAAFIRELAATIRGARPDPAAETATYLAGLDDELAELLRDEGP